MASTAGMNRRTKAAATAAVLVTVAGTALMTAPTASAWTWSSVVTLTGSNGCGGLQTVLVSGVLNGQSTSWSGYGESNYRLTFTNVPSGGGWAWVWSNCGVAPDHGTWIHVTRPVFGSTIGANLGHSY